MPAYQRFGLFLSQEVSSTQRANLDKRDLEKYCIPMWGNAELMALAAVPLEIEKWLDGVDRAQKTKSHIKGVMRQVFEYAMADGLFPISRNPLELVKVKGASKRRKQKRILTYEEWERFIGNLTAEPQRTAIITCLCLGVRREEVWALKWSDFNFVAGTVRIQRTIIGGKVYERVKNDASEADLPLDESLVRLLLDWRSKSEFNRESDWVWASPSQPAKCRYISTPYSEITSSQLQRERDKAGSSHAPRR